MDEKISIIVPVYNVEEYVGKCLDSIINQTYKNLEIICIDDGSTDNSGKICDDYAKADNRIVVIHKTNGGVASARNVGFDLFTGEYLGFVDPDDWIESTMFEKLYKDISVSNNIDISSCGYFRDYPDGKCIAVKNDIVPDDGPMIPDRYLYHVYQRDNYRSVTGYIWNKLFKKKFFKEMGFRCNERITVTEDVYIFIFCATNSQKIVYRNEQLYHYFQRETSLVHNPQKKLNALIFTVSAYQYIIDTISSKNYSSDTIKYAKRFYCYHSSLLLEYLIEINDLKMITEVKNNIRKYLDVYIETNKDHPERIDRINYLLKNSH